MSGRAPARSKGCCTKGKEHAMVEMLKNSNALSASISARIRSISSRLDEHGTIVLQEPIDTAKRAATYFHVSTDSQFANDARSSMISRKMPALAEFPLKRNVATDCGSQGPMSQQNTGDSGRNELHPQKLVQLVGFRDPNARKHEGAASIAVVFASAA
jgi:hypothetical protein